MYKIYILKSANTGRHYIGHTDDLYKRLSYHNGGKVKSTKAYRPWQIVYTEEYTTKQDAYRRERQIKSYKSGEAFKRLLNKERCLSGLKS